MSALSTEPGSIIVLGVFAVVQEIEAEEIALEMGGEEMFPRLGKVIRFMSL